MARCSVRTKSSAASSIVAFFPQRLIIATSVLIKTTWAIRGETRLSAKSVRMSLLSATISTSWAFVISLRTSVTPVDEKLGFKQADSAAKLVAGGWQKAVAMRIFATATRLRT